MEVPAPPDDGARWLLRLFAQGLKPDPRRTVAEWAEAERIVSEGAYEGRWRSDRTPYLVEPMVLASLHRPTRMVTFRGSAQIGKTQIGLNTQGQILSETPAQAMVVLPSLNTLRFYNRDKLARMIDATPILRDRVAPEVERNGQGSTTAVKRGARGAQIELVTASSSNDLQGRTARVIILEEETEYDQDVGGRGSPIDQALARTIQWRKRGEKVLRISTPGIKGSCTITAAYEAGSQGRFMVRCPECEHEQELLFANLTWEKGKPETARYACDGCGVLLEERHKARMLRSGRWVHAHPQRLALHASYTLSTLYSPFTPWSEVAKAAEKAESDPSLAKAFWQQWLGEPFDQAFDLPKAEMLERRRDAYPANRVPPGVLFLVGATDVQGDRLEWAVWGFDRSFGQWLIGRGSLPGDPARPEVWALHDHLLQRRWTDAWGRDLAPVAWGIDTGYLSSHVYAYARRFAHRDAAGTRLSWERCQAGHFPVRALDGRKAWKLPPIGKPTVQTLSWDKTQKVLLYPVGTWDMKSELATALRLTEQGPGPEGWPPGALHYNELADRAWIEELISERFMEDPKTGARKWTKVGPRNEHWDIAVYARALARDMALSMTAADWTALERVTQGAPEAAQPDLLAYAAPVAAEAAAPAPPPLPHVAARAIASGRRLLGPGRTLR